jgi:hypothetical protein
MPTKSNGADSSSGGLSMAVLVPVAVSFLVAFAGGAYWSLHKRSDDFEKRLDGLEDRFRAVETAFTQLRTDLQYRRKAVELGIGEPEIRVVDLAEKPIIAIAGVTQTGVSFSMEYTVINVSNDALVLNQNGRIGDAEYRGNVVTVPLTPGHVTRVPLAPHTNLFVAVLDRLPPNYVVLAFGTGKASTG